MIKEKLDLGDQQYFFPNGKEGIKIINKIFDNEFVKEIFIDHFPGFRRETLFRIGEKENLIHYPKDVKGQTIIIDSFKKYFTLELTQKNVKINIFHPRRRWEKVISLGIPLIRPVKTGMRKWKEVDNSYTTWLIISTLDLFIQLVMQEDVFEKYRRFEQRLGK